MKTEVKWVKKGNGWYESDNGRFAIQRKGMGRPGYTVIDRELPDPICPQYRRMDTAQTIEHGMNIVARWVRNGL